MSPGCSALIADDREKSVAAKSKPIPKMLDYRPRMDVKSFMSTPKTWLCLQSCCELDRKDRIEQFLDMRCSTVSYLAQVELYSKLL